MKNFKKGKRITSIEEFEKSIADGQRLFIVGWCDGRVRHIGFIGALQYRYLKDVVINKLGLWIAEKKCEVKRL